jgi:hypothetical protein
MKRCLACKALFERADWTCPNCGYQPALRDEIRQFMDERSETHAGFKPEYFARLASSRNQISGFVRGTSSFRGRSAQASIDLAPRGLRDSGAVSLSAATSLAYASPVWWSPRRLFCHRRFGRSPVAFSIFHWNEQLGPGASNRRCARISLLGSSVS